MQKFLAILLGLTLSIGCSQPVDETGIADSTDQSPTATFTETVTRTPIKPVIVSPTPTLTPTITPTPKPYAIEDYSIDYEFEENLPLLPEGAIARLGSGYVADSAVSNDGNLLAIAAGVGFYIYRLPSLELYRFIPTPRLAEQLAFTPDGATLVGGGLGFELPWDATWSVETGERITDISQPLSNSWIGHDIAYSPDGTFLAVRGSSFGMGGELVRGSNLKTEAYFNTSIHVAQMTFSPDSTSIAIAFYDGSIEIQDLYGANEYGDLSVLKRLQTPTANPIISMDWSPDGRRLIVGAASAVWLFDVETEDIVHTFHLPNEVTTIKWTKDGSKIIATTGEQVFAWDSRTYDDRWQANANGSIVAVDSQHLFMLSADWQFSVLDVDSGEIQQQIQDQHSGWANDIAYSPDGKWIAGASGTIGITLFDASTYSYVGTLDLNAARVVAIDWSADSSVIAGGYDDGTIHLWNVITGLPIDQWATEPEINGIAWSPDNTLLAVVTGGADYGSSDDDALTIYDVASHTPIHRNTVAAGCCYQSHLYWSEDSQSLAMHGDQNYVWKRQTNETLSTRGPVLWSASGEIWWVDLNASQIRTLDDDSLIVDFETRLLGNDPYVPLAVLVLNPDHARMANASGWGSIIAMFDMDSGSIQKLFVRHTAEVFDIDWSPDGSKLIASSRDGTILVWDVSD